MLVIDHKMHQKDLGIILTWTEHYDHMTVTAYNTALHGITPQNIQNYY